MNENISADKQTEFDRIQKSIKNIKHHSQIEATQGWINKFQEAFNDQDLTDQLKADLDWNGANYKVD